MTKLYIPSLKDKIRLRQPWTFPIDNSDSRGAAWRVHYGDTVYDFGPASRLLNFTLEEGTVLEFKRYHMSSQAKKDHIDVTIFASPRRDLMPRNRGGTSSQVKFTVKSAHLDGLEYERMELP